MYNSHLFSYSKKALSFILTFILFLSLLMLKGLNISAAETSDYSVVITSPESALNGEQITLTITVTDITYPEFDEGKGIFSVAAFLHYDSSVFTPAQNGFSAVVPLKWDKFDGTSTAGVWGLYAVFDGNLSNGAVNDGDISFTVTFDVSESAVADDYTFYISGCECTGYSSTSIVKIKSFDATAGGQATVNIPLPTVLVPNENTPFTIDTEKGIIYSQTPKIDYDTFKSFFSQINGELTIKAFDYEITSENSNYIPSGANISIHHEKTGQTIDFTYYLLGDCDCNGKVTITDLAVVKSVIVNRIAVDGYLKYSMEFEKDGVIRIADYLRLKVYIASKKQ